MLLSVTLLSLVTLAMWGLSDYLAGHSGRNIDTYVTNFVVQAINVILFIPLVLLFGFSVNNLGHLTVIAATAGLFTLAYVYLIRALAKGPVGVAAPIANSYAVVTLALSLLFFGAVFSAWIVAILVLIVIGVVLLSADRKLFRGKVLHSKTVKLAAVPLFTWGAGFALLNTVVDQYAWHEILFALAGMMTLLSFVAMMRLSPAGHAKPRYILSRKMRMPMLCGVFGAAGAVTFFLAAGIGGDFVIPAVIASASPLVTAYAAYLFDKEKLTHLNRIGAVLVVLGIALLNI